MRLYTSSEEVEVLLDALKLLRREANDTGTMSACDVLITRITDCKELQVSQPRYRKENHEDDI